MESSQSFSELSYFVNKEISDLCNDEDFAVKSQEILCRLSELSELENIQREEIFLQSSLDSFEIANINRSDFSENDYEDFDIRFMDQVQEDSIKPVEAFIEDKDTHPVASNEMKQIITQCKETFEEETKENKEMYILSSSETTGTQKSKKRKGKSPREVEPNEFLSLKRKDVIFKSIFRMMRRFF